MSARIAIHLSLLAGAAALAASEAGAQAVIRRTNPPSGATAPSPNVARDPSYTPPPPTSAPAGVSEGLGAWEPLTGCARYLDVVTRDDATRTNTSRFRLGCAAWPGGYVLEARRLGGDWKPTTGIGTSVVADDRRIYLLNASGTLRIADRPYGWRLDDQVGAELGAPVPLCFKGFVLGFGVDNAFGLSCTADANGNYPILLVSRAGLASCAEAQRRGGPCTLFPAPAGGSVTQLVTVVDATNHLWAPWALTSDGGIWRGSFDEAPSNTAQMLSWIRLPGCGRYVSADETGRPWVIGCEDADTRGNFPIYRWTGGDIGARWEAMPGRAVRLFWGKDERVMYALAYDGTILRYKGP